MITCVSCKNETNKLEIFPGNFCLNCWAALQRLQKMETAEQISSMWGSNLLN